MEFCPNLAFFSQKSPTFEGKLTRFLTVLAQNTCMFGRRPRLYYSNVNIGWLGMFMQPGMGIMDNFTVQPHHFLPRQPPFLRKKQKFHGCSGPKKHVYAVVIWHYTSLNSILVRCQGSSSRGWKSQMDFYPNLAFFSQKSPNFEGKLTRFLTVLAQNTCMFGWRPGLYYSNVNSGWLGMFMQPGRGIMDNFPVQHYHLLPSQPPFSSKT